MAQDALTPVSVGDVRWGELQVREEARRRRWRRLQVGAVWMVLVAAILLILLHFELDVAFIRSRWWFIISRGIPMTVGISLASVVLASMVALIGAACRLATNPIPNGFSGMYVSLFRGTPLLVQIYVIYLGLPQLGIVLTAVQSGILALTLNYGAYMTEIFRAGIQSIGYGQREAAMALGMTPLQAFRRVVWPQAIRLIIPPVGNEFVAMLKDSSLVMIMGVWELTFVSLKIGRANIKNLEMLLVAAVAYWVLTFLFSSVQGRVEARVGEAHAR